ncbi:PREDICTED: LOW QUALITY PROTEIN: UPF0454 protein C12orf49 homolog [Dinoponera quadriceps]|uniref:SREBP regulating gene protein n=1 Tax=Dinoponera quadriceps TaxID=609295 RepID=A0A6P3XHM6_DINQU|nr:PREDICTED: LOW QUALITY PROTEIN: UPF0454 protein C12orf49 homolog [Dinoponera quadriceps]
MPSYMSLIRLIRRRLVLGLIFALSLTYCAFSLLRNEKRSLSIDSDLDDMDPMMINDNNEDLMPDDDTLPEQSRTSGKPPLWQMELLERAVNTANVDAANLNESDASTQPCRNSIQGKALIVDERGIVCARHEVLPNGCCRMEQKQTPKSEDTPIMARRERYSCKTCNPQGCCTIYEYCVSCCLHPGKQIKGRKDVVSAKAQKEEDAVRTRIRNLDRFQICLAACRTSSASVRHENTYKDPFAKHCYAMQPSNSHPRHRRDVVSSLNNNNGDSPAVVVTFSSVLTLFITHLSPECRSSHRPVYRPDPNANVTRHLL